MKNSNHREITLILETSPPKSPATFKQLHALFVTSGLALDTYPLSRLLRGLAAFPPLHSHAAAVLRHAPPPSSPFLSNTLTSSLAARGHTLLALSLYSLLLSPFSSPKPNNHTYPSLLKACAASPPSARHGRSLHAHLIKFLGDDGVDSFVRAALVNFYSKCGRIAACRYIFDQIPDPDLPTWNSILSAYARRRSNYLGRADSAAEALALFEKLQFSSIRPNEITLVALIGACGDFGALCDGAWAHAYVVRNNLVLNRFVGTALIEMYAKCGRLDLAHQVFDALPQRDTLCYNAMIRGLAIHGHGRRALTLFDKMRFDGPEVDDVTMVAVLCACAHAGLVAEGRNCFTTMEVDFGITPRIEHFGCLVDLLGRAGLVEEAEDVLRRMSMKPNAAMYRSLIRACRIHNETEIGERLIRKLIQLEPEHGGNYVLSSNLYADINQWDGVDRVRKAMKAKGIDKTPGSSTVEIGGVTHEFLLGDRRHPLSKEVYSMLDEIERRLLEHGHSPRTKEVLFDVEEEDKEDALTCHSERLAIAFALLSTEKGATIRIIKNLRVCSDCHASSKLISRIYGREIIMRDRSRFHHFRDGVCSCSDYW